VLTSERTLNRLKSPRLSQDEVSRLLSGLGGRYQQEIQELLLDYKVKYSLKYRKQGRLFAPQMF
jgi:hypothetical protein